VDRISINLKRSVMKEKIKIQEGKPYWEQTEQVRNELRKQFLDQILHGCDYFEYFLRKEYDIKLIK
jgi:hypothetical protein